MRCQETSDPSQLNFYLAPKMVAVCWVPLSERRDPLSRSLCAIAQCHHTNPQPYIRASFYPSNYCILWMWRSHNVGHTHLYLRAAIDNCSWFSSFFSETHEHAHTHTPSRFPVFFIEYCIFREKIPETSNCLFRRKLDRVPVILLWVHQSLIKLCSLQYVLEKNTVSVAVWRSAAPQRYQNIWARRRYQPCRLVSHSDTFVSNDILLRLQILCAAVENKLRIEFSQTQIFNTRDRVLLNLIVR